MSSINSNISININTNTSTNTNIVSSIVSSTIANRIKLLPMLDTVDKMYVADRDDGPGTNGTTLY